jgi:hypothetical protein
MIDTCSDLRNETVQRPRVRVGLCDGCGATMQRELREESSATQWGNVWLCDDCLRATPPEEIERSRNEIALRGVPLS